MNQYLRIIFIGLLGGCLAACSNHNTAYLKQSQTVHPIVAPSGVGIQPSQSFYPVSGSAGASSQPPSMVPPGSNLDRFKKKNSAEAAGLQKQEFARLFLDKSGQETLLINAKNQQAWAFVGDALHRTPYKVLDQDEGMNSFYVLDKAVSGGRIQETTPIYRVYLQSQGNQTEVGLLDQTNKPVDSEIAKRILSDLQEKLPS